MGIWRDFVLNDEEVIEKLKAFLVENLDETYASLVDEPEWENWDDFEILMEKFSKENPELELFVEESYPDEESIYITLYKGGTHVYKNRLRPSFEVRKELRELLEPVKFNFGDKVLIDDVVHVVFQHKGDTTSCISQSGVLEAFETSKIRKL